MKRVVVFSSNLIRHRWFVAELQKTCKVEAVIIEKKPTLDGNFSEHPDEFRKHFKERELCEANFFELNSTVDKNLPNNRLELPWGGIGTRQVHDLIHEIKPEFIILFGSSIVRNPLLSEFRHRIINMHLGLSPYYRGSATNLWPLVDGCPECVGVTIHFATPRVDGGNILLQGRPLLEECDSVHDIGCKAIISGVELLKVLLGTTFQGTHLGLKQRQTGKLCRRNDFNYLSLRMLNQRMSNGMIADYLKDKDFRDSQFPIVEKIFDGDLE